MKRWLRPFLPQKAVANCFQNELPSPFVHASVRPAVAGCAYLQSLCSNTPNLVRSFWLTSRTPAALFFLLLFWYPIPSLQSLADIQGSGNAVPLP